MLRQERRSDIQKLCHCYDAIFHIVLLTHNGLVRTTKIEADSLWLVRLAPTIVVALTLSVLFWRFSSHKNATRWENAIGLVSILTRLCTTRMALDVRWQFQHPDALPLPPAGSSYTRSATPSHGLRPALSWWAWWQIRFVQGEVQIVNHRASLRNPAHGTRTNVAGVLVHQWGLIAHHFGGLDDVRYHRASLSL
eukprot:3265088-Amphidinium_carterae.1